MAWALLGEGPGFRGGRVLGGRCLGPPSSGGGAVKNAPPRPLWVYFRPGMCPWELGTDLWGRKWAGAGLGAGSS